MTVVVSRLSMLIKLKIAIYEFCTSIVLFQACLTFLSFQIGAGTPGSSLATLMIRLFVLDSRILCYILSPELVC